MCRRLEIVDIGKRIGLQLSLGASRASRQVHLARARAHAPLKIFGMRRCSDADGDHALRSGSIHGYVERGENVSPNIREHGRLVRLR